ncbi:transcription factor S-II, central domain-containing protein [Zopfochytrium polystomum]|nr:transcription factor S-II, central domain-containing protein [Zopfochytrium polystomum]
MVNIKDSDVVEWRREIDKLLKDDRVDSVITVLQRFDGWNPTAESLRVRSPITQNSCLPNRHSPTICPDPVVEPNECEETQEMAKNLIMKWKKAVSKGAAPSPVAVPLRSNSVSSNGSSAKPKITVERQNSITSMSPATSSPSTPAAPPAPALKERTFAIDKVSARSVGDKARDKTIELFYSAIGLGSENDSRTILNVATQVEEALYRSTNGVNDHYKAQFRVLWSNIKDKSNVELRERILSGAMTPKEVATAQPEQLIPDTMKEKIKAAQKHSMHYSVSAGNQESETDAFRCGKCGKRKCTYYQKQTRSADEPMTTFVTCLNCGHKWKFS